ncbi:MAG: sigma-54 dependent transcriptional regulator [Sphaerochaetaceae bacterium]|jgi:DNA-binding NtrC family response regulator|nr:sigma-54 dependent transcriptional regulator [Sphaerochaetaceae bacterium]
MARTILIADDESSIRAGLSIALEREGYKTIEAADGLQAWNLINSQNPDCVITDLRMPELTGEELLRKATAAYPRLPIIVLTGHGTVETAVQAMRNGASDFLTKPVNLAHLSVLLKKIFQNSELASRNEALQAQVNALEAKDSFKRIIGKNQSVTRLMEVIGQVAPTKASVLITGESGVGKELVADAIFKASNRADKPFVKVHCMALAEGLLESELFGHEKGAFTGAVTQSKGRFELADGGTIFLDEIGEINQSIQIKILRVLQEMAFERVGGQKTINVDVRVIAATNRNLEEEIRKGSFREDLYYRLNVVHLEVPPLRDRKDDIPLLAQNFLETFAKENSRSITGFSNEARNALFRYSWPGNIRELRNAIESAVVLCRTSQIELSDLPYQVSSFKGSSEISIPLGSTMDEAEKAFIMATLGFCNGNKSKASEVLGIGRKTLFRKLQSYGEADES